jgi:carbamoyltransferase
MYRLLQEINQLHPQWSTYANSNNCNCLKDLIYKGILSLSLYPPKSDRNRRIDDPAPTQGLSIVELQTKTTPTCLSAYIGQG